MLLLWHGGKPGQAGRRHGIGPQPVDFGGVGNLLVGNRVDRTRCFSGWIDEVRFYTGSGDANFVENIRQASTPIVVSALYPDGMSLLQGTNALSFTASSVNGINAGGIKVAVNGVDVSSNLVLVVPPRAGRSLIPACR